MFTLLLLTSCDVFQSDNETTERNFNYPMNVGNSWEYARTISATYDSLGISNGLEDESYSGTALVEVCDLEFIFNEIEVYNFKTTINDDGHIINGHNYYSNKKMNCVSYGYTFAHVITPKRNDDYSYLMFKGRKFSSQQEIVLWLENNSYTKNYALSDSITYDPVTVYEYPLQEGKQWIYRFQTSDGQPWRIDKVVMGWMEISTSVGDFMAWKIKWLNNPFNDGTDWDESIQTTEYFAECGLVKRIWIITGIEAYNHLGELIGTQTWSDEIEIRNYNIVE